jgi:hypothetical protein
MRTNKRDVDLFPVVTVCVGDAVPSEIQNAAAASAERLLYGAVRFHDSTPHSLALYKE